MPVTIYKGSPRIPEVLRLLEMSDDYMASLYPPESNHLVDVDALEKENVTFLIATNDDTVVGCCALVEAGDGTAEIKRMFVDPEARGLRIGKLLMEEIVVQADRLRLSAIRLETGISQPEAIGLYRKAGFVEIEPFGSYRPDPLSMFMELPLASAARM